MDRCELVPAEDYYKGDVDKVSKPTGIEEEFYCETCGEYVNGPCNDDDE